jgi:nucleotide-binding universal stress UspA family protein
MGEWKRICCAVDFEAPSRHALAEAAMLSRRPGAELLLVHAIPAPRATGEMMVPAVDLETTMTREATRRLELLAVEAESLRGGPVGRKVYTGDPAGAVVRAVREEGCDLVVVGTHGRTGLKRLVLGSVAEQVVREAPCDVLVARPSSVPAED